ncbi:IS3 family transposase, partial [Neisseria lactamica]
ANCWDNAPMESFFAVLKTECFYNAGELTVDELMKQIDDYMDYDQLPKSWTLIQLIKEQIFYG